MRIDKFLKIALIFKTRSSAEKAITKGLVLLNGKITKPAANIKIGDKITVKSPFKEIEYEITNISEKNVSKKEAKELVKILKETRNELA